VKPHDRDQSYILIRKQETLGQALVGRLSLMIRSLLSYLVFMNFDLNDVVRRRYHRIDINAWTELGANWNTYVLDKQHSTSGLLSATGLISTGGSTACCNWTCCRLTFLGTPKIFMSTLHIGQNPLRLTHSSRQQACMTWPHLLMYLMCSCSSSSPRHMQQLDQDDLRAVGEFAQV
jgi:hypothetical protein